MGPKDAMKQLGWMLVGNIGVVLGIFLCMTLIGIPVGVFMIIVSAKMFWKAAKAAMTNAPTTTP